MTTLKEVSVPDIGNYTGVEVIEVAVKPGTQVKVEDPLVTLETEKASMDVPSPFSGTIKEMKLKVGDKVSQGDLIALIETEEIVEQKVPQAPTTTEDIKTPLETFQTLTVKVPELGTTKQVEVIEVAIKPGDSIKVEDTLITLESEKASMDIPSPYVGRVESVLVKLGDKVSEGQPIAILQASAQGEPPVAAAKAPDSKAHLQERTPALAKQISQTISVPLKDFSHVHAGPATRRLGRELGVDLTLIQGTGQRGRITVKDVQEFVKGVMQAQRGGGFGIEKAPEIDFSQFGEVDVKPLSRIKKWTAKNLHRNWVSIPHVTQFDEADITELEEFRKENQEEAKAHGTKLTPLPFIIMACVSALKAYPQFNASLASNGTDIIMKNYFHIGVAVDTPNGLLVPVIRNADKKGLYDIAKELGELGALAREGKLKEHQMQGTSFTISSLGGIGGTAFTPIINAPDLAILGVSKLQQKPLYIQEQFVMRKMLPLSLSYDHRVIDGVEGARFAAHVASQLQDIRKLLL